LPPADFKSAASTDFATGASQQNKSLTVLNGSDQGVDSISLQPEKFGAQPAMGVSGGLESVIDLRVSGTKMEASMFSSDLKMALSPFFSAPDQGTAVATPAPLGAADVVETIRKCFNPQLLQGRVVLVTGGSRGIGRAIAIAAGAVGAQIIVNYAGNAKAAADTVSEIEKAGAKAQAVAFDVAQFNAVQEAIKALEKDLGRIDVLINNAGVSKDNLFVKFKEEDWDANLDINLKGSFHCARAVAMGMMRRRSGKIINISSVIGLIGNAGQAGYAASKAGLLGLTKSLARELATRNVQVNAIAPGYITTDMTSAHGEKLMESVLRQIPMEKLGDPVEIAKMAIFLSSTLSDYITGQTFAVDGGMTMV
jgi:3-oxoacyl-[acyl-carrier protein] reductase